MGLTDRVWALAARRPRCYVVEAPGGAAVRRAVEDVLDDRDWRAADSPASADVLVVAGPPLPDDLRDAAGLLWTQLPGPRVRLDLVEVDEVAPSLDSLGARLADRAEHRRDARDRDRDATRAWVGTAEHQGHDAHEEHEGHGGHEMAPGGIPLAGGADDRDGLEMDVLEHPWGPLLSHWPGGAELVLTLHGDVVGDVEVVSWPPQDDASGDVQRWDAVATTLALAGDAVGARLARRGRGAAVRGGEPDPGGRLARDLRARLSRWRRWQVLPPDAAERLLGYLDGEGHHEPRPGSVAEVVRGRDLADARLALAAWGPTLAGKGTRRGSADA